MLAFSLLLALVPQTPKPLAELKFEMAGNRIYLPAVLNGRTTPAIFDTGAGASAVDLKLADDLKRIAAFEPVQPERLVRPQIGFQCPDIWRGRRQIELHPACALDPQAVICR